MTDTEVLQKLKNIVDDYINFVRSDDYHGDGPIYIPKDCAEVIDTKFSTADGESMFFYLSITCRKENNEFVVYNAVKTSIAGAFGFGRIGIPKVIKLEKRDVLEPEWR